MIIFKEPPKRIKRYNYNFGDLNQLVKDSYPGLGAEYCSDFMKKFGYTISGICDSWELNEGWEKYTNEEKWKYVALCALYWLEFYQYLNNEKEYEAYKNQLKEWSKKNPEFLITLKQLEDKEIDND